MKRALHVALGVVALLGVLSTAALSSLPALAPVVAFAAPRLFASTGNFGGRPLTDPARIKGIKLPAAGQTLTLEAADGTDFISCTDGAPDTCTITAALSSASLPDPYTPADGTWNLTGSESITNDLAVGDALTVTGVVTAQDDLNTQGVLAANGGFQINAGLGAVVMDWRSTTVTPTTLGSLASGACTTTDHTLSGIAAANSDCRATLQNGSVASLWNAGCTAYCAVQTTDSVRLARCNHTAGALDCDGSNTLTYRLTVTEY